MSVPDTIKDISLGKSELKSPDITSQWEKYYNENYIFKIGGYDYLFIYCGM